MRFPHGLLFHHFHDAVHPEGQGSITADTFFDILKYIGLENIVSAEEWMRHAFNGSLSNNDICITFDDNLRCQYDIAAPVLRELGLTAFWFVYTSPLDGIVEKLELYRYFRSNNFPATEDFYEAFYAAVMETNFADQIDRGLLDVDVSDYLGDKPFYSLADRKFRYIRNRILKPEEYDSIMDRMIDAAGLDRSLVYRQLWMDEQCLRSLYDQGHLIGLHSHSHHTGLASKDINQQKVEYSANFDALRTVLKEAPITASYPFGEYNEDTLSVMNALGVRLGFRADMDGPAPSNLEFPRENHATIMMRMSP